MPLTDNPPMKNLIINNKSRWFVSIVTIIVITLAGFFFFNASSLARSKASPREQAPIPLVPIYTMGNFTFSTPVEMVRPLSPIFFQQGGEPEVKVDIFGNIYVTAIQGVPGGVDLWKSIDNGTTFVYLGQPDGAQDKCSTLPQCAGLGGGDDQIDLSSGGYLYVSSLWLGSITMSTSFDGGTGGVATGQAWQVQPAASNVPVDDRQWIAAYGPQTVYMSMRQAPGTGDLFVFKSTDAGKTFAPTTAGPITGIVSREGNLVVDQYNGNLYTSYIPNTAANQI